MMNLDLFSPAKTAMLETSRLNPKMPAGKPMFMWCFGYRNRDGEYLCGEAWGEDRAMARANALEHCAEYQYRFDDLEEDWTAVSIAGQHLRKDQFDAISKQQMRLYHQIFEDIRSDLVTWSHEVNVRVPKKHGEEVAYILQGMKIISVDAFNNLLHKLNGYIRRLKAE